jgi:nitrate/nitrite transport system substrate-binding protein
MVKGAPDYAGMAKRVLRPDLYLEAMKELGMPTKPEELSRVSLFDTTLDAREPEKYAQSFTVNNLT